MNLRKERIDKTAKIEEALESYIIVCLSGMPGIGRKTAISMLLEKHTEVTPVFCSVEEIEDGSALKRKPDDNPCWYLVRKPEAGQYPQTNTRLWTFIRNMGIKDRIILAVDGLMPENFLEFIWNGIMAVILPETFLFTEEETGLFLKRSKCDLRYREVYYLTGGWAGCIAVIVRLSRQLPGRWSARELCCRYEIRRYVERNILSALPEDELRMVKERAAFPVLNEELVSLLWEDPGKEIEDRLFTRGAMVYMPEKKTWHVQPMLRLAIDNYAAAETWYKAIEWYERNGYIQETLETCWHLRDMKMYRECLIRNYDKIPFLHYENVEQTRDFFRGPELFYLNWMEYYLKQEYGKLQELRKSLSYVWKNVDIQTCSFKHIEILLNIAYTDMTYTAKEWIKMVERWTSPRQPIRIYFMLGESVSYLCGIRDLSELFSCSQKERSGYKKIWQERISSDNQMQYYLAEMEYNYYTDGTVLRTDNKEFVLPEDNENASWQIRLGSMYLSYLYVDQKGHQESARKNIQKAAPVLEKEEGGGCCRWNAKALSHLAEVKWGEREKLMRWIKETGGDIESERSKTKFYMTAEVKINLYLGNYARAEELLKELIPYFEVYHNWRWLAESLFQKALIENDRGDKGQALKTMAQSFAVANPYRYVRIYTGYGKNGAELLEEYRNWTENAATAAQRNKKKYKYGNVLRMPNQDWLDYIVRKAARQKKNYQDLQEEQQNIYSVEKLTMTEQMVLQYLNKGYTNAQISKAMNIKLSTAKTHIYNIYKKLGVSSRVQAMQKAQEYGML